MSMRPLRNKPSEGFISRCKIQSAATKETFLNRLGRVVKSQVATLWVWGRPFEGLGDVDMTGLVCGAGL